MFACPTTARRALAAVLAAVLAATVLSGDSVFGQNGTDLAPVDVAAEVVLPSARVAVLGDGFLAAPAIAPVRPDRCVTSTNGPVERAARRSPGTVVVVDNETCVGATLLSVGQEQVPELAADTDVVIIGGLGLEFDWEGLATACLHHETRAAEACTDEASLARATAANSFFSWRSLLQQVHRQAPDANIVLVAPPVPVSGAQLALGSSCCNPSTDGHAQIRSVFDTSAALRSAVIESISDLPVVMVQSTATFEDHRIDHTDAWLVADPTHAGTPTADGADALANLIEVLMPVAMPITAPPGVPSEIVLVLGTTNADGESHRAIESGATFWINTHRLAGVNPSIAVIPLRTSDPVPTTTTTTTTTTTSTLPPIADDSAVLEVLDDVAPADVDAAPAPTEPTPTEPVPTEPVADATATEAPTPAVQQRLLTTSYTTSGEDLARVVSELSTSAGVTTVGELADALVAATDAFTPTVTDRQVLVRAVRLDAANASTAEVAELREALTAGTADVTIIARGPEQAARLAAITEGTGAIIDSATPDELADVLPAPEANPQLVSAFADDIDAVLGRPANASVTVEVTHPGELTVTWQLNNTIIASGQQPAIDPSRVGVGTHNITITVESDRETLTATAVMRVTVDGDNDPNDACDVFDPFGNDLDGDGTAGACDEDDDGDGLPDGLDPCPTVANSDLRDIDLDGLPDRCDNDSLDGPRGDVDGDGFPDLIDNCPTVGQNNQFDADADGIGNACEIATATICTITGTNGDDQLTGTSGDDIICGLAGDDHINGLGGNDVILAGPGNDIVFGSSGNDLLLGGAGNDELHGNGNDDDLLGELGDDVLRGGFGSDVIAGGPGADDADGQAGFDVIFGGRGPDVLRGGDGADTIDGEQGNDDISGELGNDLLTGGPGADRIGGGRANDTIVGVGVNDVVRGGTGDDLIDTASIRIS